MSICRQQWKHGEGYLHYLGLHFCKWSWRFGQDYWCPQLSIMQNHHRGMWLAPCDCLQEDSDSKHKTEVMTNNLNLELTAQPTQSCTQRHRVCYNPWKRMTWGRLHPQKVSGSSSKVLGPTYQAPNAQQRLQMRWFAEGSINNGAGPRLLCVWGRSPVGRCQPGQFKGAACAFCGEGRHTTRIIMTATSETYDVIVVGGGISGGCITISCVWRGSSGVCRVVWRGNEQMLVAIYRTRQLLLEARSLKCFSLRRCRVRAASGVCNMPCCWWSPRSSSPSCLPVHRCTATATAMPVK